MDYQSNQSQQINQEPEFQPSPPQGEPLQSHQPNPSTGSGQAKKIWLYVLIGLIIAGGAFGFYIWQKRGLFPVLPSSTVSPTPTVTPDPTATWQTYRNEELGIEFKHPSGSTVQAENAFPGLDTGEKIGISILGLQGDNALSLVAVSEDFDLGVGEGCCFFFKGPSISLDSSDTQIASELSSELGYVRIEKRVNMAGKQGIRFLRLNSYVTFWPALSTIIPINSGPYTNVLVSINLSRFFDYEDKLQAETYVDNLSYRDDPLAKDSVEIYDQILSTFRFIDQANRIESKKVEYRGDASLISPEYADYNYFSFCDNSISQCRHYLIIRSEVARLAGLRGIDVGDQVELSGDYEVLGVATGNHYFKMINNVSIRFIDRFIN
ncbi:MAG: hypothetical protein COV30_01145 [Candidatus Yanofskybacteria bacterium CG10_big_fil_rev_8_21_14_0_10_37_15]|uniref:Uncharacterized protein n=1 Tax=Candidatus Yanofskybacteria bacterium CG10_big_fil_rev_8_21_14_0_10_37_15 TaxID=1975097 RepID=A0A2H0R5W0_9BACT|nr:MAG: hypothetical protein COV30_01145 [Candidatus Yanofskybacteria bacterium CG10_big_fil_rev_8_21_14_0_10_37_15]